MTTLPIAHTWADVHPGTEYMPATPLRGWRISVALIDGTISPFVDHGSEVHAQCGADPDVQHHDGTDVHPGCVCGLYLIDTRQHLADYWPDAYQRHAKTRADLGTYRWGGIVICRAATAGTVTGRAERPGMVPPPDTIHTYRAAALTLDHVYVPTGTSRALADRIRRKYPDVPVTEMRGPVHTIRKPEYSEASR